MAIRNKKYIVRLSHYEYERNGVANVLQNHAALQMTSAGAQAAGRRPHVLGLQWRGEACVCLLCKST